MASFVVETYVALGDQSGFATDVAGIRAATEAIVVDGRVRHIRSYLVPSDEMGFHVVEAASAADVTRVIALAGIDVERIVKAIGVGPGPGADDRTEEPW